MMKIFMWKGNLQKFSIISTTDMNANISCIFEVENNVTIKFYFNLQDLGLK